MTFRKNTFNKSPRRIHRNIGGRKKGTLISKREMMDILKGKKKRNNITWSPGGENDYF